MFKKLTEKLKKGLARTKDRIFGGLQAILPFGRELDQDLLDEMEDYLYSADIGPKAGAITTRALSARSAPVQPFSVQPWRPMSLTNMHLTSFSGF